MYMNSREKYGNSIKWPAGYAQVEIGSSCRTVVTFET